MGKPIDIPDDIWNAARAALIAAHRNPEADEDGVAIVARAIMAERERCEAVCVTRSERHKAAVASYPDDEISRGVCLEGAIEALECAGAIRKGAR